MDNYEICQKLKISGFRFLFDSGSDEYNSVKIEEKLSVFCRIVLFDFNINEILKEYKKNRADYIRKNIKPTLIEYISFLETSVVYDYEISEKFKNKSEKFIVEELNKKIKEILFPKYNIEKLILSYIEHKFEYNSEEYNIQKAFFKIDFDKNIHKHLSKRNEVEGFKDTVWSYSDVYTLLETTLFSSIKNNEFHYLNTEVQMPFSPTMKFITDLNLPKSIQDKFLSNSKYRKEKLITFAKELVQIVYFDKPLFDFETYFIRNNFGDESFSKTREELLKKNLLGILVDQDFEIEDWEKAKSGLKVNNPQGFVNAWFSLQNKVLNKNIIVVSSYLSPPKYKIGLISKGSEFFNLKTNSDVKVFQLDNVVEVDKKDTPIFNAVIVQQKTISPIHKRKNFIISKYLGRDLPLVLENLSENSIEILCSEWLRSHFVSLDIRIKSQLLKIGGNNAKIDIFGITEKGKKIAAQVSYTKNKTEINKKIANLLTAKADKYFMFCLESETIKNDDVKIFSLEQIFTDLKNDKFYRQIIEELINN